LNFDEQEEQIQEEAVLFVYSKIAIQTMSRTTDFRLMIGKKNERK
jgi:hypothetical protein